MKQTEIAMKRGGKQWKWSHNLCRQTEGEREIHVPKSTYINHCYWANNNIEAYRVIRSWPPKWFIFNRQMCISADKRSFLCTDSCFFYSIGMWCNLRQSVACCQPVMTKNHHKSGNQSKYDHTHIEDWTERERERANLMRTVFYSW